MEDLFAELSASVDAQSSIDVQRAHQNEDLQCAELALANGAVWPPGLRADALGFGANPALQRWEVCEECGVQTHAMPTLTEHICPECSRVYDRPSEEEQTEFDESSKRSLNVKVAPRLRIVGPNASVQQRILDKSSVTDSAAAASQELLHELMRFNAEYQQETRKTFPLSILERAAEIYVNRVRAKGKVIRAQNKQAVLAMIIYACSRKEGRTKKEAAQLMQLPSNGLARGENRLRSLDACGDILNGNPDEDHVNAVFVCLGLQYNPRAIPGQTLALGAEGDAIQVNAKGAQSIELLKGAAMAILECGKKHFVGVELAPPTRATGAVYCVLRRAAIAGILPPEWRISCAICPPSAARGSNEWVSSRCNIRPQTVDGYLRVLSQYHSKFRGVYEKFGLDAAPYPKL